MAYTVSFYHGDDVLAADYTPGVAVAAGDVVVQASMVGIARHDIAANVKGALAINGGVWKCPKATGSGDAIAAGTLMYWDAANEVVTATAGSNKQFGYAVEAAAASQGYVYVAKVLP